MVGLFVKCLFELVIGVLVIWKVGGVYVLLDLDYFVDWIEFYIEDSGVWVVLV